MSSNYLKLISDFILDSYTNTEVYVTELSFGNTFLIVMLFLVIWFISGFFFALWVRKDLNERGIEGYFYIILILLTSFIGFIVYEIFKSKEECELDPDELVCALEEADKTITEESEEEYEDDIEDTMEENVKDVIDEELKESSK